MEPIISVQKLTKHFPVKAGVFRKTIGTVKAVDGIDFEIQEGKTFSLIGESGCGKTTTSRMILLLHSLTSGAVFFKGENIIGAARDKTREYRRSVQAIFQDPYTSLQPRMRVRDIIAEPLLQNNLYSKKDAMERVEEVLTQVRLPGRSANFPHEFSGGERQRIALARAIAPNPKLIILDEPVSALDVSVRAAVMNNLKRIQDEYGLAYLLIAHNLDTIRYMTHTMGVMYLGRIVEIGPGEELFNHPQHPYTEALLKASLPFDPHSRDRVVPLAGEIPSPLNVPAGCAFHMRCYKKGKNCLENRPELREVASGHWVACSEV